MSLSLRNPFRTNTLINLKSFNKTPFSFEWHQGPEACTARGKWPVMGNWNQSCD